MRIILRRLEVDRLAHQSQTFDEIDSASFTVVTDSGTFMLYAHYSGDVTLELLDDKGIPEEVLFQRDAD